MGTIFGLYALRLLYEAYCRRKNGLHKKEKAGMNGEDVQATDQQLHRSRSKKMQTRSRAGGWSNSRRFVRADM